MIPDRLVMASPHKKQQMLTFLIDLNLWMLFFFFAIFTVLSSCNHFTSENYHFISINGMHDLCTRVRDNWDFCYTIVELPDVGTKCASKYEEALSGFSGKSRVWSAWTAGKVSSNVDMAAADLSSVFEYACFPTS